MSLLQMIPHNMGTAVMLVSHDHRVLEYADRIVRLEDGHTKDRERTSFAPAHVQPATAPTAT